jgi:endonuclease-8
VPEGDTIAKLARFLDQALSGQPVREVVVHPALGRSGGSGCVDRVSAHGKHLDIDFADGRLLRSHLGMYGSWHRYRAGGDWRRPRRQMSILLRAAHWDYVCFNAKHAEWLARHGFRDQDHRARLGHDLICGPLDDGQLLERTRTLLTASTPLVDVLLDQRLAAGIGNVYKSELLFLEHLSPLARLGDLADAQVLGLYRRAAALLRDNLGGGARRTRFERDRRGQLWVYGRRDLACLRCRGGVVRRAMVGERPRSTYWCDRCQTPEMGPPSLLG